MRRFTGLLVAASMLIASYAIAGQFTELARTNTGSGALYLRGHLIPAPYVFEVDNSLALYVRVDHDPEFASTGTIRLPLSIPDVRYDRSKISPAALAMLTDDPNIFASRSTVDSLALVTYYDVFHRTGSRKQAATAVTAVYGEFPELVDSAHVTDDGFIRYWHNCPVPFSVSCPTSGKLPADPLAIVQDYADELVKSLNADEVLCFGTGGLKTVPALNPVQFATELEALHNGQSTLRQLPSFVRRDFEKSRSAATILKMADGGK